MTLRRKLMLVALSTLALPLVGAWFVRQMDQLLRQGQAQALTASAHAMARSLVVIGTPLPQRDDGWYVQRSVQPITVDGYGDDWAPLTPWQFRAPGHVRAMLASAGGHLYMFARVADTSRQRADAGDSDAAGADHLNLLLARGDQRARYRLASAAPGPFLARGVDVPSGFPPQLSGVWQEDGSGYQVELALPDTPHLDGVGLSAFDGAYPAAADPAPPLHPLWRFRPALAKRLEQLAPDGTRVRLLAPSAWLLAQSGHMSIGTHARPGWLAATLYRWWLAAPLAAPVIWAEDAPRIDIPEVMRALAGTPASRWREGRQRGSVVLSVAVPVRVDGRVVAALSLEQASRALPLLANRALTGLLLASFGVLLLAALLLFVFATRLSLRLSRLRDAAEHAQARDGRYEGRFPQVEAADELGDLARSFARLFEAIGGYTDYLRTLASKLSHELNTPLAIVKSSLDNLDHSGLPDSAKPYLDRARDGVLRMGQLVRAMSETSRMERAIAAAEAEDMDLVEVVHGCAEAYRALAGTRRLSVQLPDSPLPLHGAPELVAQALDKLFDNAMSFTPAGGWIRIGLRAVADGAEIEVANQGPRLPEAMAGRLFQSLVSMRGKSAGNGVPHLGLGLYVVRLVAERHGGRAQAHNLASGEGVVFRLLLRGMPRQRLA